MARFALATTIISATTLVLVGCNGGTQMGTTDTTKPPKDAVTGIVDDSATAVGGSWEVYSGPAVEACDRDSGGSGAAYAYTRTRGQTEGDPAKDVATVEALWKKRGISTERYESGGADPTPGVRGVGGPTGSIDFLADVRGYSIDAVSVCGDGDAADIQRDGG
ncbi:hypothetical protein DEI91_01945 [Curtobacterium sp. MCBD17_032]|nr:hypothetical protein DEI91_01945 [Curtobacterium sp. MCBD17_032]